MDWWQFIITIVGMATIADASNIKHTIVPWSGLLHRQQLLLSCPNGRWLLGVGDMRWLWPLEDKTRHLYHGCLSLNWIDNGKLEVIVFNSSTVGSVTMQCKFLEMGLTCLANDNSTVSHAIQLEGNERCLPGSYRDSDQLCKRCPPSACQWYWDLENCVDCEEELVLNATQEEQMPTCGEKYGLHEALHCITEMRLAVREELHCLLTNALVFTGLLTIGAYVLYVLLRNIWRRQSSFMQFIVHERALELSSSLQVHAALAPSLWNFNPMRSAYRAKKLGMDETNQKIRQFTWRNPNRLLLCKTNATPQSQAKEQSEMKELIVDSAESDKSAKSLDSPDGKDQTAKDEKSQGSADEDEKSQGSADEDKKSQGSADEDEKSQGAADEDEKSQSSSEVQSISETRKPLKSKTKSIALNGKSVSQIKSETKTKSIKPSKRNTKTVRKARSKLPGKSKSGSRSE